MGGEACGGAHVQVRRRLLHQGGQERGPPGSVQGLDSGALPWSRRPACAHGLRPYQAHPAGLNVCPTNSMIGTRRCKTRCDFCGTMIFFYWRVHNHGPGERYATPTFLNLDLVGAMGALNTAALGCSCKCSGSTLTFSREEKG